MPPSPSATLSELLRHYRQRAGLTQQELAERAELSVDAISALERGIRRRAYPHTMRALAEALALSGDEQAAFLSTPREPAIPDAAASEPAGLASSLPEPLTPMIGREREKAALAQMVQHAGSRLVTLTGPGGVGKTRLAIQVAARARERFTSVHFVGLAPLTDSDLVPAAIAQTLGIREWGRRDPLEGLASVLEGRRVLLLLDNFEHVAPAAHFVGSLVARFSELTLLVTSRAALRLRGEQEFPVSPLAIPPAGAASLAHELFSYPAVRLFVERARAHDPQFVLTPANAPAIATICAQLDGLPLAIELAAARTRILSPAALAARLSDRLDLLSAGAIDAPPRQRTLRDAIAWSYDLLSPAEQALFRRLAVFAGSFTLEAAGSIGGEGEPSVLDRVESLVRASLLLSRKAHDEPRFVMLQTIRDFAAEALRQSGEEDPARRAHGEYYLARAEASEPWLRGPQQRHWLDQLEADIDNVREALRSFAVQQDAERGVRLASALHWFWWERGYWREGQEWLAAFLALDAPLSPALHATALNAASYLAGSYGADDLALARSQESVAIVRDADDREGIAWALAYLAVAHYRRGDLAAARAVGEQSLARFRALDHAEGILFCAGYVGIAAQDQGDVAVASSLLAEAAALGRRLGDRDNLTRALLGLGILALYHRGEADEAQALFQESLELAVELGHPYPLMYALECLASVALARGDPERALRLGGAAAALREARHAVPAPQLLARHQRTLAAARQQLPEARQRTVWEEGQALTVAQAIAYARGDREAKGSAGWHAW